MMAKTVKKDKSLNPPKGDTPYLSIDERTAKGRALRDVASRASHAGWKADKNRHDSVQLLNESNVGRIEEFISIRFGRMAESPFAFY